HYDVRGERQADLVAAGAVPVGNRELARALSARGLRFRKRRGERPLLRVADGLPAVGGPHVLDVVASPHEPLRGSGAAVVLITDPAGWLVLVRSAGRDGWAPPGGKRDPGEVPRDTAVREVAEETGLQLARSQLVPVGYERITITAGQQRPPWDAGDNHIAVFGTRIDSRPQVQPAAEDVVGAEWVDPVTVRDRCATQPWWALVERFTATN